MKVAKREERIERRVDRELEKTDQVRNVRQEFAPSAEAWKPRRVRRAAAADFEPRALLSASEHAAALEALHHAEVVSVSEPIQGGGTFPRIVTLRDAAGREFRAVFKPASGEMNYRPPGSFPFYTREIAAYRASEAMGYGWVPPTIERAIEIDPAVGAEAGSLQLFVEGADCGYLVPKASRRVRREDVDRMLAFDYVLGNVDRALRNILLRKGARGEPRQLVPIDHGQTFSGGWRSWRFEDDARQLLGELKTDAAPSAAVRRWIDAIDAQALEKALVGAGLEAHHVSGALERLAELKKNGLPDLRRSR